MPEYRFNGQKSGEVVMGIFHRSFWAFIKDYLLAIAIFVLFIIIGRYMSFIVSLPRAILIGGLIALLIVLRTWYLRANTLFLVTNLRIIALCQNGIFRRDIKESYISEVSQVAASIDGFLQSLFNFGNVTIQTYGELILTDIRDPNTMKESIYDATHQNKKSQATSDEKFWQVEGKS